jgi:hypothetical protein
LGHCESLISMIARVKTGLKFALRLHLYYHCQATIDFHMVT